MTRRAALRVESIHPWSAVRTTFLLGATLAVTLVVAFSVLTVFLRALGLFDAIDRVLGDVTGNGGGIAQSITLGRVVTLTALIGAFETVVLTALSAVFAFLYNATVPITGGFEVTLAEEE